jgi:hypothetical protein
MKSEKLIRLLIESILVEGIEEDRKFLIRKFPAHETDLIDLPIRGVKWLSARFGEQPTTEESSTFSKSLSSIKSFIDNENAIKGNVKKLETEFSNVSVTDPSNMTASDIDSVINALKKIRSDKGKTVDVNAASNPENDVLAIIGGWKISLPTTRENSCVLGLRNSALCTTRDVGNNLWAHYIVDSILFTLTPVSATVATEKMFIWTFGEDCLPRYGEKGGYGAETVDGGNNNLQESDIRLRLGSHFDEIQDLLISKCRQLGGKHPAYNKVEAATKSLKALKELTRGIKGSDLDDIVSMVAKKDLSKEVELALLVHPSDSVRSALAGSRFASTESLVQLAKDTKDVVSSTAKSNPKFPVEELLRSAQESSDPQSFEALASSAQNPEVLMRILGLKEKKFERARSLVAQRQNLSDEIIEALKHDPSERVRRSLAQNESISTAIMRWMLDNDRSVETLAGLSRNKKLPLSDAMEILNDASLPAVVRLGAFGHPDIKNDIDLFKRFMNDRDGSVSMIASNAYSRLMKEKRLSEALLRQLIRETLK